MRKNVKNILIINLRGEVGKILVPDELAFALDEKRFYKISMIWMDKVEHCVSLWK